MSSVIDVSFISLKAVLPVALSLAAAPMHLLALIKPQFEASRKHSKRGIIRNAMVHQAICDDITSVCGIAGLHRYPGVSVVDHRRRRQYRILHRRAPWLNASSSITSASAGDGVAFTGGRTVFVPYTLGGETVDVEPAQGDPERRAFVAASNRPAPSGSRRSADISAPAAVAPFSIGSRRLIARGNAGS